jgi:transcriptional regulator with XRE-family HTH domain
MLINNWGRPTTVSKFNLIVGTRIRELREQNGLSREKMSEIADINDKYLYEIEVGKKGLSAEKMFNISRSLGVTMDYLVSGEKADKQDRAVISLLSCLDESEFIKLRKILVEIINFSRVVSIHDDRK